MIDDDVRVGGTVFLMAGPQCGNRNPASNYTCRLPPGHDGAHAFVREHLDAGRVRQVWA